MVSAEVAAEAGEANPKVSQGGQDTVQTHQKARVTAITDTERVLGSVWRRPLVPGPTKSLQSHREGPTSLTEIINK